MLKPVGKWVTRCGPSSGEVSDTPKNSTKPDISSTIAAQPAPADSPMLGKWKYVECVNNDCNVKSIEVVKMAPIILRTSTFNYLQNGVVESFHKLTNIIEPILAKGSWKYTPQNASSGILEEHNGEDLVESGSVKFLNQNKLEYTITFSPNSATIGKKVIWERISSPPKSENNQPTPLPRPLVNPKDELRDKHLKEADRLMQPESYIKAIEYYSR